MHHHLTVFSHRLLRVAALAIVCASSGGCAVITVASAATSVAVTGASLVVDAGVGAVKLTGRAVGAAVDLAIPDASPP
jgi:hypothetical protein